MLRPDQELNVMLPKQVSSSWSSQKLPFMAQIKEITTVGGRGSASVVHSARKDCEDCHACSRFDGICRESEISCYSRDSLPRARILTNLHSVDPSLIWFLVRDLFIGLW